MKFKTDNLWQRGTGGADSVEDSADSEESPDFPCCTAPLINTLLPKRGCAVDLLKLLKLLHLKHIA